MRGLEGIGSSYDRWGIQSVLALIVVYPISRVLAPVVWPKGVFTFDLIGPLGFFALAGAAGGAGCAALVGLLIAAIAESVRAKNQR
ncbi:hypothetical protein [Corynebacterium sp. CCM 9203]|uniref:hypothetical protein n=1 Tax=Corynebacterium sp. CCM 9203 TaxID=3057615 RepID=UPI003525C97F